MPPPGDTTPAMRLGGRGAVATYGALATIVALVAAAPVSATDLPFEAEGMTPSAGTTANTNFSDSAADGGKALALYNNGAATKSVSVPQSTTHLLVRVRGTDCNGAPMVSVKIDGIQRFAGAVSTGVYRGVGARLSIPAGAHTVSVNMTNDYTLSAGGTTVCDRNLFVDSVRIVGQPFSPTGWRNTPLPDNAPLAPNSAALAGDITWQIDNPVRRTNGTTAPDIWVTTTEGFSDPIYVVTKDQQPRVNVTKRTGTQNMGDQWMNVPLPDDARPAPGEGSLVLWQPDANTLWEFGGLQKDALGRWSAVSGGRIQNVSGHEGQFEDPPGTHFGQTGTAISLLAGIPRIEELKRGVIDHAIDFAVMGGMGRKGWCWPAHRTDHSHTRTDPAAIPAGTRFRLPASLNLDDYDLTPWARMIAEAVQKYGMVARDEGEGFGFWAEDPTPTGQDPYHGPSGLFGGLRPDSAGVFRNFPWTELQALEQHGCEDRP